MVFLLRVHIHEGETASLFSGQAAQDVLQDLAQPYHASCLVIWEDWSPGEGFLRVPSEVLASCWWGWGMTKACIWMAIDPSSPWLPSSSVPSHGVPGPADQQG